MCRWFLGLPTVCLLLVSSARGDQTFPYKAYVTSGEVYVRSGPGKNYYPTSKLKTGDQVEVYRHDPGGWFAIRPPSGSFTWVSARYLEKSSHGLAKVVGDQVAARVGSEFSDIRDVIQVRLHRGEVVEILETKEFRSGPEAGTWCKVAPPSGEFRWVSGKFVDPEFPHDGVRQTTAENNPLIHPTAMVRPERCGVSRRAGVAAGANGPTLGSRLGRGDGRSALQAQADPRPTPAGRSPRHKTLRQPRGGIGLRNPAIQPVAAHAADLARGVPGPTRPARLGAIGDAGRGAERLEVRRAGPEGAGPGEPGGDGHRAGPRSATGRPDRAVGGRRSSATTRSTISRRRRSGRTASLPRRLPPAPPAGRPIRPSKDSTAPAGWRGSSPRSSARRSTPWWTTRTTSSAT